MLFIVSGEFSKMIKQKIFIFRLPKKFRSLTIFANFEITYSNISIVIFRNFLVHQKLSENFKKFPNQGDISQHPGFSIQQVAKSTF